MDFPSSRVRLSPFIVQTRRLLLQARRAAIAVALLSGGGSPGWAGTDYSKALTVSVADSSPFERGTRETALTAGFFYSPLFGVRPGTPVINYVREDFVFGWMLTSPGGSGCLRGNWEFLLNAFGAGITHGPGSYLAGGRLLLRYNFVQPGARVVPFIQIGGGGLKNDVYHDRSQRVIGSGFEFTLVGDIGVRFFVTPKWAIVIAADYEHISNANTADRNRGLNALGGTLGVTTFF